MPLHLSIARIAMGQKLVPMTRAVRNSSSLSSGGADDRQPVERTGPEPYLAPLSIGRRPARRERRVQGQWTFGSIIGLSLIVPRPMQAAEATRRAVGISRGVRRELHEVALKPPESCALDGGLKLETSSRCWVRVRCLPLLIRLLV
jgi:hypothetical protein